ncbi:hypothetical protein GCM10009682_25480 [Luedemannella flava]|uniref:Uncharacterized protein n=1 Tax=Luedemannella flava TaxID=349316 RepID=A0ABP4Y3D0_9ACTN
MPETSTEGYVADEANVQGLVRNLCAYALSEPDPLQRYDDLTHQQVLFEGVVAAIRLARGRALADALVDGMPVDQVAQKTNLRTAPKVRKLIADAGETERVKQASAAARRKGRKTAPKPPDLLEVLAQLPVPAGRRLLTADERAALMLPESAKPRPARAASGSRRPRVRATEAPAPR